MPVIAVLGFRPIGLEDLSLTVDPNGATFTANVGGVGSTTLNSLAMVQYTDFTQAASSAQAALSNVQAGGVYYNTALGGLAAACGVSLLPLIGTVNGVNLGFTLPSTQINGQVLVVRNGVIVDPTTYSVAGSVLTFNNFTGTCTVASGIVTCAGADVFPTGCEGMNITLTATQFMVLGPVNTKRLLVSGAANGTYSFSLPFAPVAGDILYAVIS